MTDNRINILITGGAGFIGSNFIHYFTKKYPNYHLVNLDLLTYAGNLSNLDGVPQDLHTFIHGDICDRDLVESLFKKYRFQGIIHFAAESHVDNSISDPSIFIKTNVMGTFTLLDVARKFWMSKPFETNDEFIQARFHHISTDEVYGSLGDEGYFTEDSPYLPNSPYAASKASSNHLVRSYIKTYGLNAVVTNSSNNFGPRQHEEKFIPTIIRNALLEKPIPVYGNGKNVRDWIYVEDHCRAISEVFFNSPAGEFYNIGGECELSNLKLCQTICSILDNLKPRKTGKYTDLIHFVDDRPGHDYRYAISNQKINRFVSIKTLYSKNCLQDNLLNVIKLIIFSDE